MPLGRQAVGVDKWVPVAPIRHASSFIISAKASTEPAIWTAMALAASFPDGIIKP